MVDKWDEDFECLMPLLAIFLLCHDSLILLMETNLWQTNYHINLFCVYPAILQIN